MSPSVVTLDCAETLLHVRWQPGPFAVSCARDVGLPVEDEHRALYERMLRNRWPEYREVNLTRDPLLGDAFWKRLTEDWLEASGHPADATKLLARAHEKLYGPEASLFEPFEDVFPALDTLKELGIRLAVLSNWDYSLHRILANTGLTPYFETVVASLEEGVEKPEPAIFRAVLDRLGVGPEEVVHVGDNPLDDLVGAQQFGIRALLIDRTLDKPSANRIARLTDIPEVLGWTI